jgi:hypothetical protein
MNLMLHSITPFGHGVDPMTVMNPPLFDVKQLISHSSKIGINEFVLLFSDTVVQVNGRLDLWRLYSVSITRNKVNFKIIFVLFHRSADDAKLVRKLERDLNQCKAFNDLPKILNERGTFAREMKFTFHHGRDAKLQDRLMNVRGDCSMNLRSRIPSDSTEQKAMQELDDRE